MLQNDKEISNPHSTLLTVMSQTKSGDRWTIQDVAALPDNEWIRYEILFAVRSPLLPNFACEVARLFMSRS